MNNRGFTLVELLVTVAILGIIAGISIPLVRNISLSLETKKYNTYSDTIMSAGKLYNDSYNEDLFGHKKYGCAYIKYTDLINKNLIKDIKINNVTCNTNDTYVMVIKYKEKYYYSSYIGCKNTENGNIRKIPENRVAHSFCDSESTISMDIVGDPKMYEKVDKKRKTMKVLISSASGISKSPIPDLEYGFSYNKDTNVINDTWNKLELGKIPSEAKQEELIVSGNIPTTSEQLITPEGVTGKLWLVIKVNNLRNLMGDSYHSKYVYLGVYTVDNTKPVIDSVVASTRESGFNSKYTSVKVNSGDNYTTYDKLKICIKEGNVASSACTGSDWVSYGVSSRETAKNLTLNGGYDGTTRTISVYVKDLAGNISAKKTTTYTVYKECSKTKVSCNDWGKWGACSKKCNTGNQSRTRSCNNLDKYTNKVCSKNTDTAYTTQSQQCNTMTCCSKTVDSPGNWGNWGSCSKKCGGGTKSRTRTVTVKSYYDNSVCSTRTEADTASCNTQSCDPYYNNSNTYFKTLQAAINGTADGGTIYLSKNYNDSGHATLDANKVIIFNVNGHTLNLTNDNIEVKKGTMKFTNGTINTSTEDNSAILCNGGTVHILASVTIHCKYVTDKELGTQAIRIKAGAVKMYGGTVSSGEGKSSGYAKAVHLTGGSFDMSGGTIIANATKKNGHGGTGINNSGGTVVISGGVIDVKKSAAARCCICANSGTNKVKNGATLKIESGSSAAGVLWGGSGSICYEKGAKLSAPKGISITSGNHITKKDNGKC